VDDICEVSEPEHALAALSGPHEALAQLALYEKYGLDLVIDQYGIDSFVACSSRQGIQRLLFFVGDIRAEEPSDKKGVVTQTREPSAPLAQLPC
jgi:hypothetical protein